MPPHQKTGPGKPARTTAGDWLAGGGEMGGRVRAFDWASHPLGPLESWPFEWRTSVSICMASRFPIVLWLGPDLHVVYNDAYIPIFSRKHPDALGRPGREAWGEIWDVIGPMLHGVLADGKATWSDDQRLFMQRNGYLEETYFTFSYSPIHDEACAVTGVFCAVNETTPRVLAERRTATVRELASCAAESRTTADACQALGGVLARNPADVPFALLYLVDADDATARLCAAAGIADGEAASPHSVPIGAETTGPWPFASVRAHPQPVVIDNAHEQMGALPGGVWPEPTTAVFMAPLFISAHGKPDGFWIAGVNRRRALDKSYLDFYNLVTAQITAALTNARAYEEERRRVEALAELDRAKTTFFSNVSHEFRTPLTLILGPLQDALEEGAGSNGDRERLQTAHRNALRLQKLVNTLLDFSRIEAGRMQASYEAVDLASFTAELASNFRSACEKAGLELRIDCPALREPVYVDRDMWEKIVLNLVSNAFKYTHEGTIEVSLRQRDDRAELHVRDTGIGIEDDDLSRLFERFNRIEGAAGRSQEGSGIGLALVRELVKLHGGDIRVQSTFGAGSDFSVSIPLGTSHLAAGRINAARTLASTATTAAAFVDEAMRWLPETFDDAAPAAGTDGANPPSTPARILVADDNADLRQYLARLLGRRYTVTCVTDGEAALESARADLPDLVVSDVMMPRMDGFELLQRLREDETTRELPVLLLSARAGEEARIEGLQAGADDYVVKPFSARELLASVEGQLRLSRMRRESREALRRTEARFRVMADTAPAMLWVSEAGGSCTFLSQSWRDYTGQALDEAVEFGWLEALHPEDREQVGSTFLKANAHRAAFSIDFRLRRKDGIYRWATGSARPHFDESGAFAGFVGAVLDVHERREAEDALRLADHRKNEFLAMLAHELRNPLAPIRNAIQIMKQRPSGQPEAKWATDVIDRQITQLSRLVDDLMDVARITRGRIELRRGRVLLADVVKDAVEASQPLIDRFAHTLTVSLPPEPVVLFADSTRLAQVMLNLLNNAARYTEPGGAIHIEARREEDQVIIRVTDNGIGISAEALPRIFGLFAQHDHAPGLSRGGLGLGLTLAQRLVEMHGGAVDARSDGPGRGSEFIVRLPAQEEDAAPAAPARTRATTSPLRILVVDDVVDSTSTLSAYLCMRGHDVQTAGDGLTAVERALQFRPHVIILDIGLPERNGYDVAKTIRSQLTDVLLVALTGWGQDEDLRRSRDAGFDHHMTKPVDFDRLERLLSDAHTAVQRAQSAPVAEINDTAI